MEGLMEGRNVAMVLAVLALETRVRFEATTLWSGYRQNL